MADYAEADGRAAGGKEAPATGWYFQGAVAIMLVLGGGLGAYALMQHQQSRRLQAEAEEIFFRLREQDAAIAKLEAHVAEQAEAPLAEQVARLREQRRALGRRYDGYVQELGLRRRLDEKERLLYQVMRIFGESEFAMPAGFVRRVRDEIRGYWLTPVGRRRFRQAVHRAEAGGYTSYIVQTMRAHGLPPEFFYLALQESNFDTAAVGPRTRRGIAKGMWQFIPATAREHGLRTGPRAGTRVVDSQDERHEFKASTKAAARYLRDLYGTLAQASGLLAMAAYNWGEHRVTGKLERLSASPAPPQSPRQALPENPQARSYWRFANKYGRRMPEQTKDYVIKIVSAAVIGQDPRLFGFDFENPLLKHMRVPQARRPPSRLP